MKDGSPLQQIASPVYLRPGDDPVEEPLSPEIKDIEITRRGSSRSPPPDQNRRMLVQKLVQIPAPQATEIEGVHNQETINNM